MNLAPLVDGKFQIQRQVTKLALSAGIAISVALLGQVQYLEAAPVVGTTSAVQGQVFVSTNGAQRKAQVRGSIQLNDEVRTKDDSALQILLLDRTVFTVGQNCSMIIDEFVYDPATSVGQLSAQVLTGAFRYMSGRIGKANPTQTTLTTPSATVGIRGTFVEGIAGPDSVVLAGMAGIDTSNADPEKASIIVLRGSGLFSNTLDQSGAITVSSGGQTKSILEPGFAIFSPGPGLPPIGPFPVTAEMLAYLDFFLRSAPNGAGENPLDLTSTGSEESGQDQFENQQVGSDLELENELIDGIEDALIEEDIHDEGEGEGEDEEGDGDCGDYCQQEQVELEIQVE